MKIQCLDSSYNTRVNESVCVLDIRGHLYLGMHGGAVC